MKLQNYNILVTGGAGFIGSNLVADFLNHQNKVWCLDNLSTGKFQNIEPYLNHPNFTFIEGDIRSFETCQEAVQNIDYVFHQAALGSIPRSLDNPRLTNEVNVSGFLNMILAAKDAQVKRFIYAASSSTYGDSEHLPKTEAIIGNPLSPYAVSKYVNELYAHVFGLNYGLETIGLRYFNVFGPKQSPDGVYAAVIPTFTKLLMDHQSPKINGDGLNSRDFTYIANVIQMNHLAALTQNTNAIGQVFNTAVGERSNLLELIAHLKICLSKYDPEINQIPIIHGPNRQGDIPHSLASIDKAKTLLGYEPTHNLEKGLTEAVDWYWQHLK